MDGPLHNSVIVCFGFQFKYHTKIDDLIDRTLTNMKVGLIGKLISVLDSVLAKLTRYDEGSVIGSILSFTVRGPDLSLIVVPACYYLLLTAFDQLY